MLQSLYVTEDNAALLTDLYELTMAAAYWANRMNERATFELFFRRLPVHRSFILAAGLEQAIQYILALKFSEDQISWLQSLETFSSVDRSFFDYLRKFRFSGEVWAIPEGTPVFPYEPFVRITAPLIEAQILETYLLSVLNVQCLVATKAYRMVQAAQGRSVVDFGARRAHGPQAAVLASRSAFIGGCTGSSNVLAGWFTGIPLYGTAAHSFTMAFSDEMESFRAYKKVFPHSTVLLIDTYDTLNAARMVKDIGSVRGVRIDSGDLLELSRQVRKILDADGLTSVKIIASGNLNEYKIASLISKGAPIDLFGVGTELVTSYDDPSLSLVYKMVEATISGRSQLRAKFSPGKVSYPGCKQVYRFDSDSRDLVSLSNEAPPDGGRALLQCYVRQGKLVALLPSVPEIQQHAEQQLGLLPTALRNSLETKEYRVDMSSELISRMSAVASATSFENL